MKLIIKKHIKSLLIISLLLILCNLLSTVHPVVVKQIVDIDFSLPDIEQTIIKYIIIYASIHLVLVIFKNLRNAVNNKTMSKVLKDIRELLFKKVIGFNMTTFNKYNSAELYTRLTSDVDNLYTMFSGTLDAILSNILKIVFMVIMMFVANINLALIGAFTIFVIAITVSNFTRKLGKADNEILQKRDRENKEFSEIYNKNKLTYLFRLQKKNVEKTDKLFLSELKSRKKYIYMQTLPYWLVKVMQALGIYAVLYYALNINISVSVGSIYLVLYYIKQCQSPLNEIFNNLEELQTCLNSYNRIKLILNENSKEDIYKGIYVEDLKGDIEFQNVSMGYGEELILKDMSFIIKQGSKVTIAGRTGVGKTTLTNVLMKLYDIQKGKILINGYDISKISTKCLRDNISYISQNPYIFADTVRNNIILGNKTITDDQIKELIKEMQLENIFNKLPQGLDTQIKLSKLSYGELQVIAFIRAILHKTNIYIFDEPTSNIDLKTEKLIQNIIDKISKNSTVIIIAHRKSTIASSNKIIYLKGGKIDAIVNR